jgi:plastocyanin
MIQHRSNPGRIVRAISVLALMAFALVVPSQAAQDAEMPHPAHIHSGTCEELGDVVVPLNDVVVPEGTVSGPAAENPVRDSGGNRVEMPLQDIIDGGHAINVHLSAENIDTYIACGNIGGIVNQRENGDSRELLIPLQELNGSGYVGIAWLGEDGAATNVGINLIKLADASTTETAPAATDSEAVTADGAAVTIKSFAFNPNPIEVPVGGSVTWTNEDNVPHTATGLDRSALQSGAIPFGDSFTQEFDSAGSFDYFCEFHPNMKGTIVVE